MTDNLIFDSHAHYDDPAFDGDRDQLLESLRSRGVGNVVDVSANINDLPKILELAGRYDFMYAAAGVHPSEVGDLNEDNFTEIELALHDPKTVAVGEIGLDYHYDDTDKPLQKKWFARQIALAKETGYPIIVHSRDAANDTIDMIISENARDAGGVIHCFSYEKEMAARYLNLGFYIGIGGVLTFSNARKLKEVAAYMPQDRILLETDCPYLAPVPYRGRRNDSSMLTYVVDALAEIRGTDREEIIAVTADNAARMYRLDQLQSE